MVRSCLLNCCCILQLGKFSDRIQIHLKGPSRRQSSADSAAVVSNTASSLLTNTTSALAILGEGFNLFGVKIVLMSLKAFLLCSKMMGGDDDAAALGWFKVLKARLLCSRMLGDDDVHPPGLILRIGDSIQRIVLEKREIYDMLSHRREESADRLREMASEVGGLARELYDGLMKQSRSSGNPPEVDTVESILSYISEFLVFVDSVMIYELPYRQFLDRDGVEALEVQIRFLKSFLDFATQTGVEKKQLENLLIQIRPFVIYAAGVFIPEVANISRGKWIDQVQSKCSALLIPMVFDPQVYQACNEALITSTFSSARSQSSSPVNDHRILFVLKNFLDSFMSLFWFLLRHSESMKDHVKVVYERLRFSRTILNQQPEKIVGEIRNRIGGVVCDAAVMLISSVHQTDAEMSGLVLSDLLARFDAIQADVVIDASQTSKLSFPKAKELCFGDSTGIDNERDAQTQTESAASSNQPPYTPSQVVGFEDNEVDFILDQLTRGSNQLRIVPITGMAGLGKTTLAFKVFNHLSVTFHFHAQAWSSLSQEFHKSRVYLQLLNQIKPEMRTLDMPVRDLANDLRKSLKGRRYLIFLDDIWTIDAWDELKEAFPDDSTGSRVIFTSRHRHIVPRGLTISGESHLLRLRNVGECLEIMQAKLFPEKGWPLHLNELGMKFAEKCRGLPLTAVIVAGLLATTKQKDWKQFLGSLSSAVLSSEEQCYRALELSFKHLPHDLQLCFLYFGTFPEDEVIPVKRLIRIWMVEGFVPKQELRRIEDVALEYMEKLIERSLVMVTGVRSIGGVKTCQVHDVLHEFCQTRAKQEHFFHLILHGHDQLSEFNEPSMLQSQRLCIHSDPLYFQESRFFCPKAHSLLFFPGEKNRLIHMSFIIQIFKHLKVLDMMRIVLCTEIPSEIELLTQLRYLSVKSNWAVIPSSIGNLSNLETFVADFGELSGVLSFPDTLWKLGKLKYLHIERGMGFSLSTENLGNPFMLLELDTLSGVVFCSDGGSMERQMRKFPNLRRLSCSILSVPALESTEELNEIVVPGILNHLESLTISGNGKLRYEFGSAENLKKVTLKGFELSRQELAVIGILPNLTVLKLEEISYLGGALEMEEGEFTQLRFLKLHQTYYRDLKRWTVTGDEQLPSLQKLVLVKCEVLEEIPSCLETSTTLEEIKVYSCSPALERLVRDVEEVQKDYGSSIKVHIRD